MKSAGKARSNGLYRHIRTSKEIIRNLLNYYLNSKAPFAMSGKKKAEFPDAFVFDATRKYLEKHPNDILLVISKDSDWTTAFNQIENVIICDSISNALTKISNIDSILSQEMLSQIFRGAYKEKCLST